MDQTLTCRRVITGHDSSGKPAVMADEAIAGVELAEAPDRDDYIFWQLWATHESPADLSDDALERQRAGSPTAIVGNGRGTCIRIGVFDAGLSTPMHRTMSVDYGIVMEGEIDLEMEGGETVKLFAGDVIVQRGTNHAWHNRGSEPCKVAWILIDAEPPLVGGERLKASWIAES
jgi:mannose-6-phosphate isomerase-like protein (cupin superfamily)